MAAEFVPITLVEDGGCDEVLFTLKDQWFSSKSNMKANLVLLGSTHVVVLVLWSTK